MKTEWQFVLNETSVSFLLACRPAERRRLLRVLDDLARDPYQMGNHEARDDSGRTIQVKTAGRLLISFWADSGPKELRVINIERV